MKKPKVKLIGKDGNPFAILKACQWEMRRTGWPTEQIEKFHGEAISGDYNHLLRTVMKYFEVE